MHKVKPELRADYETLHLTLNQLRAVQEGIESNGTRCCTRREVDHVKRRQSYQSVYKPGQHGRFPEYRGNQVQVQDANKPPVEAAYDDQDKRHPVKG